MMSSTAYRNAHGVELKPGNWFLGADQYGRKEGIIDRVVRRGGIADTNGGPSVVYKSAPGEYAVQSILADNVFQTLGPMTIEGDGTVKQNPAPRSLVNRWGTRLRVGQLVSVTAARGGRYEARIAGFATSGDFVRAYGRQVVSESGATFGVDDVYSIIEEAPRKNPLTRVKVKSPAQRGGGEPSPRLTKRRKVTQKAPPGFYANPAPPLKYGFDIYDADRGTYTVYDKRKGKFFETARFKDFAKAKEYAQAYADANNCQVKITGNLSHPTIKRK